MSDWDDLDFVCERIGSRDLAAILQRGRVWLTGRRWDQSPLAPPDRVESQIAAEAIISIRAGNVIATHPLYAIMYTFDRVRVHRPTLTAELDAAGIAAQLENEPPKPAEGDTLPGEEHSGAADETANIVLPPENPATPKRARERGRKPGSGAIDDSEALCEMLRLLARKDTLTAWLAAGQVAESSKFGNSLTSTRKRIYDKFRNRYGVSPPDGKTWDDVLQANCRPIAVESNSAI